VRGAVRKVAWVWRDRAIGRSCGGRSAAEVSMEEVAADRVWPHHVAGLFALGSRGVCLCLCSGGDCRCGMAASDTKNRIVGCVGENRCRLRESRLV
jgi:hypothetical protein